ncbi:MAG: Crp/Fnr family transcriptional regulator [Micavibrio aeruginosavorus]|nr:Crp/Fnr family transcriptional regulator [Micavibrio aeruginosavorus]
MMQKETHTGQFLGDLHFFKGLPEKDMDAFATGSALRDYGKGQPVFTQGDRADRFFVILSGWIKLYRTTPEGAEAIVALFTRGDVFGEASVLGDTGYPFSAQAAEDARLIEIPASLLKQKAVESPAVMARIMATMSREMHKLQIENEHMALMSAPQRVGCLLLQLSSGMLGNGGTFSFPYDKSLAAARLGMKPETFSRALSQLKPWGVTVKGAEIHIADFHELAAYSCGYCSAEMPDCKGATRKSCGGCAGKIAAARE